MGRTGRPQGTPKGATRAADALAGFLGDLTAELTVRELAQRYGGGKTMWSDYRSGARIIPLGRLNSVVRDRVRDGRGRQTLLQRAHRLHEAALVAEAEAGPGVKLDEALRRAEADLAEAEGLVRSLLVLVSTLLGSTDASRAADASEPGTASGTADQAPGPAAAPDGAPDPEAADGLVDRALRQLEAVRSLHGGARKVLGRARAESRAALPAGSAGSAAAGTELVLALARTADGLAHLGDEVERLWLEHREDAELPLQGVVLERTDRPSTARVIAQTPLPPLPYALTQPSPVLPGAAGQIVIAAPPGRPVRSSLVLTAVLAVCTVLAIAVSAVTAVVVVQRQGPATPPPAPLAQGGRPHLVQYQPPSPRASLTPTPAAAPPTGPSSPPATPPSGPPPTAAPTPARGGGFVAPPLPATTPKPTPSDGKPAPTGGPDVPDAPNGLFRLSNAGSHLCLSVPAGSQTPADGMIQAGCGAGPEQQWHLTREAAGPPAVYSIRNRFSGLCLSVQGARVDNDVAVTHYLCGDRQGLFPDQFWTLRYRSAYRAWQLVNVNSGKCAGARAGARENEPVLQQDCRDDPWLMWQS
ncbi:RICIN domain-containing protein [Streptomyces sp. NPDC059070]|uniref:RICIN domain-containing protein n=1 Tax=Streptomyces sp. NPDC059070 TaxID=3346713 RepID=UPI0036B1692F